MIPIHRIYNRAIVDEMERKGTKLAFDLRDELDVEWAGHPNWYFQISKLSCLTSSIHRCRRRSFWMTGLRKATLTCRRTGSQLLLKPLYSFAGKGIQFGPTDADMAAIPVEERHGYLMQERVGFEPVIDTPCGPTQAEIRILYLWPDDGGDGAGDQSCAVGTRADDGG